MGRLAYATWPRWLGCVDSKLRLTQNGGLSEFAAQIVIKQPPFELINSSFEVVVLRWTV